MSLEKLHVSLGVVTNTYNLISWGSGVQGQLRLHSEFRNSLNYRDNITFYKQMNVPKSAVGKDNHHM